MWFTFGDLSKFLFFGVHSRSHLCNRLDRDIFINNNGIIYTSRHPGRESLACSDPGGFSLTFIYIHIP